MPVTCKQVIDNVGEQPGPDLIINNTLITTVRTNLTHNPHPFPPAPHTLWLSKWVQMEAQKLIMEVLTQVKIVGKANNIKVNDLKIEFDGYDGTGSIRCIYW
jgi:hypothetical protein